MNLDQATDKAIAAIRELAAAVSNQNPCDITFIDELANVARSRVEWIQERNTAPLHRRGPARVIGFPGDRAR